MVNKIALGTVQFGLDYGISNTEGQVKTPEVRKILKACQAAGIDMLDTATAYGDSEKVLGETGANKFKVVTKIPAGCSSPYAAEVALNESLKYLAVDNIFGWLYHNFSDYEEGRLPWQEVCFLQKKYNIEKIGFSLYHPRQWNKLIDEGVRPDLIQVPFNLFDRRFLTVLNEAQEIGTEVHTRSSFLQGLFFREPNSLPAYFRPILPFLEEVKNVVDENNLDLAACLLRYVIDQPNIDRVVIGVESTSQLMANIKGLINVENNLVRFLDPDRYLAIPENIINPAEWT